MDPKSSVSSSGTTLVHSVTARDRVRSVSVPASSPDRVLYSTHITAYLTRRDDAPGFVEWAEGLSFVEGRNEDVEEVYAVFMGEHGWAPAAAYRQMALE